MPEQETLPLNYSYLIGVYLAINAIPDAFLFVDGPDCCSYKAEHIYGKHDLNSTLLDCTCPNRIQSSIVDVTEIVRDRTPELERVLRDIDSIPASSAVIYTSMPMATITGTQYDTIIRGLQPPLEKPFISVPPFSLKGDWLDGYAQTLKSIATDIPLDPRSPDPAPKKTLEMKKWPSSAMPWTARNATTPPMYSKSNAFYGGSASIPFPSGSQAAPSITSPPPAAPLP